MFCPKIMTDCSSREHKQAEYRNTFPLLCYPYQYAIDITHAEENATQNHQMYQLLKWRNSAEHMRQVCKPLYKIQ